MNLFLPFLIAFAIVLYAVHNLGDISHKISFIKTADDINLTLLELRRYEKNILLFREEQNIRIFHEHLEQLDKKMRSVEDEIVAKIEAESYKSLMADIAAYRESALALISTIRTEQRLVEDIRPLGRIIEENALRKETALELRRHEKNFIIYRERQAVDKLHRMAKEIMRTQPSLVTPVSKYLDAFHALVKSEALKEDTVSKLRTTGRAVEKVTLGFSETERGEIDKVISTSKRLFISSFIFLIGSSVAVACLFSMNIGKTLRTLERSLGRLEKGDFTHGIDIDTAKAPEEITSLVKAYNNTIENLRASRAELDETLNRLEAANRELIDRQDELVEARKITAMRLLASEIAHEINNPLSSLILYLGMLYEDTAEGDPRKNNLSMTLKEANRCQAVLRELVDFAKKEPLKLKDTSPAKLIAEVIDAVRKQHAGKPVKLTSSIGELPAKIMVDPILIYQAFANIISNAYHFTPANGNIHVQGHTADNCIIVTVRDTGIGVSVENLPCIFEPFYSTRKDTGGNGLGLAITKKIIERHNGSIRVESSPGRETAFTISLPVNLAPGPA